MFCRIRQNIKRGGKLHNKAKEAIGKFLGEAEMWFTSRELIGDLAEDEVGQRTGECGSFPDDESIRKDIRICPVCEKEVERSDMLFTKGCHGITFRLVCHRCYKKIMAKGYDGQHYSEADENIDEDW